MYITFYQSAGEELGCFHAVAVVSHVAVNMRVQIRFTVSGFVPFR